MQKNHSIVVVQRCPEKALQEERQIYIHPLHNKAN